MNAKVTSTISEDSKTVHITQGDVDGIGLEVFFKSACLLSPVQTSHLILYAEEKACKETLKSMALPFSLNDDSISIGNSLIKVRWSGETCLDSLDMALAKIEKGDVLFTLPASKKSFPAGSPGHTAYLRNKFNRELTMFFHANNTRIALLTDHIPLSLVSSEITPVKVYNITSNMIDGAYKFLNETPETIVFSGINPHAGESGALGNDLEIFGPALIKLKNNYPALNFDGPLSGDTIYNRANKKTWLIYAHHDQGLAPFKAMRGFSGANITLGLDFLRLSVDHGTAPDMFRLNKANYMGCIYCLQLAIKSLV